MENGNVNVVIENFERVLISGAKSVSYLNDKAAEIDLVEGKLFVKGENLTLGKFDKELMSLEIFGTVLGIENLKGKGTKNFFKRIFK